MFASNVKNTAALHDYCLTKHMRKGRRKRQLRMPTPPTYNDNHYDGPSETPDQGVMNRQPAEIRIPIALWIQTNSKSYVTKWRKSKSEKCCL